MLNMENPQSGGSVAPAGHCPYLGLHDDPGTSQAFSSNWNFCYRAKPPASVALLHQSEFCLSPNYVQCPVYLREKVGRLPSNLRGDARLPASPRRRLTIVSLIILLFVLGILVLFGSRLRALVEESLKPISLRNSTTPDAILNLTLASSTLQNPEEIQTVLASWTNPALIIPTALPSKTPTVDLTQTTATPSPTVTRTPTPSRTPTATSTSTSTKTPDLTSTNAAAESLTASPYVNGTCGHTLDVPFSQNPSFVIHVMGGGESLNMYANQYQTTTDAILAINNHLTIPVKSGQAIVIPVGTSSVIGIPPFVLYQTNGTIETTQQLADQFNADVQALRQYNALTEPCTRFMGWVLIPSQ
jgi:LysM repeat protein